jgi:site-specific DNA-methyltransferase (adenine-specific)
MLTENQRYCLYNEDCLTAMKYLPDGCVDMVMADLPYGTTQNKWDSVIPLESLWKEYRRVCKKNAAIVLTSSQPFTSVLTVSNLAMFRHEWIWIKNRGSNFANTVREPFKEHESVLMFSQGRWTYNKQMQPRNGSGGDRVKYNVAFKTGSENYRQFEDRETNQLTELRVPSSWQKFNTETNRLHPTVKPVALMEYLIRTYTQEGMTVLDNTMGSGTTGVACMNTKRRFIGMEMDTENGYFAVACKRISEAENASELFSKPS